MIRTYDELIRLSTFEERFKYLKLDGAIGDSTFGFDRYINQRFYKSQKWKTIRDEIIIRDNGCDLAMDGYAIFGKIIVHHMNPIKVKDITEYTEYLTDPNYLICTSITTHNALHYGNENILQKVPIERTKNDTCPWRK